MSAHRILPVSGGIKLTIVLLWFRTNRCRIQQHFGTRQRHTTRSLGKPLIPTNSNTDLADTCIPHLESGISRTKIALFLIPGIIGNVRFSVDAHNRTICIDHRYSVKETRPAALKKTYRQYHTQLSRQRLHTLHDRTVFQRPGKRKMSMVLFYAKIGSFEELLQQHNLRTLCCCFPDQLLGALYIVFDIPTAGHLGGRYL